MLHSTLVARRWRCSNRSQYFGFSGRKQPSPPDVCDSTCLVDCEDGGCPAQLVGGLGTDRVCAINAQSVLTEILSKHFEIFARNRNDLRFRHRSFALPHYSLIKLHALRAEMTAAVHEEHKGDLVVSVTKITQLWRSITPLESSRRFSRRRPTNPFRPECRHADEYDGHDYGDVSRSFKIRPTHLCLHRNAEGSVGEKPRLGFPGPLAERCLCCSH
jgi:hypothetical protein